MIMPIATGRDTALPEPAHPVGDSFAVVTNSITSAGQFSPE